MKKQEIMVSLAAFALLGMLAAAAGCNGSKETVAPDAGKAQSAADRAKQESPGKM